MPKNHKIQTNPTFLLYKKDTGTLAIIPAGVAVSDGHGEVQFNHKAKVIGDVPRESDPDAFTRPLQPQYYDRGLSPGAGFIKSNKKAQWVNFSLECAAMVFTFTIRCQFQRIKQLSNPDTRKEWMAHIESFDTLDKIKQRLFALGQCGKDCYLALGTEDRKKYLQVFDVQRKVALWVLGKYDFAYGRILLASKLTGMPVSQLHWRQVLMKWEVVPTAVAKDIAKGDRNLISYEEALLRKNFKGSKEITNDELQAIKLKAVGLRAERYVLI